MNLTYENFHSPADSNTNDHAIAACAIQEAVIIHALNPAVGELGSLISKLLDFKKKITPGPLKKLVDLEGKVLQVVGKNAKFIAPVASVFGPVGMLVGAAVTLVGADYARAQGKAQELKAAAAQGADLVRQYQAMAGTVPGRLIGEATLRDVMKGWILAGGWPPVPPGDETSAARGSGNLLDEARDAVAKGLARGATTLKDIYDTEFAATIQAKGPDAQWLIPNDPTQAQLIVDALDWAFSQQKSDSLPSYGVATQNTTPGAVLAPPSTAVTTTPVTTTSATTTPAPSADVNAAMVAAMQALAAQGQTASSINAQILAALNSSGTEPSAAQQAAIADAAAKATTGQPVTAAGAGSVSPLAMGFLAAAGLAFALARPARSRGSSRRRRKK